MRLIEQVNPGFVISEKVWSRVKRLLGVPADYPAFSDRRLNKISELLSDAGVLPTDQIFFHGATPWISFAAEGDYYIFTDCCFYSYIENYHDMSRYDSADIERIGLLEKNFFARSKRSFFSSRWALEDTCRKYELNGGNFTNIGQGPLGGVVDESAEILKSENAFLFVGLDFAGKGGPLICDAFQSFRRKHPDYQLIVAGQEPPRRYREMEGVVYAGYIDKSTSEGREKLIDLYQTSKAMILLTRKDIAPVVIIEAGQNGCITIANRHCAIPEMLQQGQMGILIENSKGSLEDAMERLANMEDAEILGFRHSIRGYFCDRFNWSRSIDLIMEGIAG